MSQLESCKLSSNGLIRMQEAIARAGYTDKVKIGMDVAASEFHKDGKYDLDFKNSESDPSKWVSPRLTRLLRQGYCCCSLLLGEEGGRWASFLHK